MTRIDFHSKIPDKLGYACRLARKAYAARAKVVLLAETPAQALELNEALWSLSGVDFVPHVMAGDPLAPETPVIITADEGAELPHRDILINLTRRTPAGFEEYARLFELISTDSEDETAGRQRFAAYKRQAFQLDHHVAGQA